MRIYKFVSIICLVLVIIAIFFITKSCLNGSICPTSNADSDFIPQYKLVCFNETQGFKMTWEYTDLSDEELNQANIWTKNNNCTLTKLN